MNFFCFCNFHFPLGNNVSGQKRSSQYCCGPVCLAKTHYTGYYCGRRPGVGSGGWEALMKILMTLKPNVYKAKNILVEVSEESLFVSLKQRWGNILSAAITDGCCTLSQSFMFSVMNKSFCLVTTIFTAKMLIHRNLSKEKHFTIKRHLNQDSVRSAHLKSNQQIVDCCKVNLKHNIQMW